MTKVSEHWFASWFDSPYYHILYRDRGHKEAEQFMDNLTQHLALPKRSKILDLACGKGRHSIYLNSLGYDVVGADLSENSIAHAKTFENESLRFVVHDMCKPFGEQFDAVFNLFTSFGYFENDEDNLKTIKAIKSNLKPSGYGVIDFMNVDFVIDNLIAEDKKTIDGIDFKLNRYVENGYILKDILFEDDGNKFKFQERVKAMALDDFKLMFDAAGVELVQTFGDYNLGEFNSSSSSRLIMIFK